MLVTPESVLRSILAELIDTGNLLEVVHVHLYQNDITPTPDTVIGDFTEADFTGYAEVGPVTWGDVYTDGDGFAAVQGGIAQFTATGATISNTVYGYYCTDAAGTLLLWSERFESPVLMDETADAILQLVRYVVTQQ